MTYTQAVEFFHSFLKFGINPGLERIKALCEKLGNPQNELKFIHVAGTNGKGSTSAMIAEILKLASYKVGLFTSPYVVDFRERIQINGQMIEKEQLAGIAQKIKKVVYALALEGIEPTEFEVITAAAFLYFAQSKCDVVVLEVGLGGRLDSTNIIKTPLLSIITSISLDHINILGSTIEQIALEKCGIIKEGGITVSYPEQLEAAKRVITETAYKMNNKLIIPKIENIQIINEDIRGTKAQIDGIDLTIPLIGEHMVKNCSVAVAAARALNSTGLKVSDENISAGVANTSIAARMEVFNDKSLILLDGGHNEGCAKALQGQKDSCGYRYDEG
jgi:dihydrofolate synthase/folylpolyglutamate synthase